MAHALSRKERNDIERSIRDRLSWDSGVDESDIGIDIVDGTAVLTGSVPTFFDRQHAEIDALNTPGVERVDNRLVISYPARPAPSLDREIRRRVRSILSWSSNLEPKRLRIEVENGVVVLDGTVDSYRQKIRVAYLAANVTGVIAIRNRVAIVPSGLAGDRKTGEKVVAALDGTRGIDVNAVDVEVERGTVTLFGSVPDTTASRSAEDAAARIQGVAAVDNRLTIL